MMMVIYKVTAKKDGEEFYRDYFKTARQAQDAAQLAKSVPEATDEWYAVSVFEPDGQTTFFDDERRSEDGEK